VFSPDYRGVDTEAALVDFKQRIAKYEAVYAPIADRSVHYIKLIDMCGARLPPHALGGAGALLGPAVGGSEGGGHARRGRHLPRSQTPAPLPSPLHPVAPRRRGRVTGRGHMDVNRISGYIPGKIVTFLMQVCKSGMASTRKIWLTRHGESEMNRSGRIGGDSNLAGSGEIANHNHERKP